MSSEELIVHDAEIVGEEITPTASGTLFHTEDPIEVIQRATRVAGPLADLVRKQKLTTNIQGREHVRVEGWTLLGSMLGVFAVNEWTRETENGWEARVEARTRDGAVVGAAEAQCDRTENTWKNRDGYALRSMAQTRATSKALRQPLGFVMQLAGFDPTPAEEMPRDQGQTGQQEGFSAPLADQRIIPGPKPLTAPNSWAKWEEMISAYDQQVHDWFEAFAQSAARFLFGPTIDTKKLATSDKKLLLQKCAGAAIAVRENFEPSEFPPPSIEDIRGAFAMVMDGVELAIPDEQLDEEAVEAADRDE